MDDYQNCFSMFDISGGSVTKRLAITRPDWLINNLRTTNLKTSEETVLKYFVKCFSLFLLFLKKCEKENWKLKDQIA